MAGLERSRRKQGAQAERIGVRAERRTSRVSAWHEACQFLHERSGQGQALEQASSEIQFDAHVGQVEPEQQMGANETPSAQFREQSESGYQHESDGPVFG